VWPAGVKPNSQIPRVQSSRCQANPPGSMVFSAAKPASKPASHIAGDPSCGGLFGMAFARWFYAPTGRRDRGFIQRSPTVLCPNGAQGDSPGQSKAPPWDWCARNNPSPERAEPAARKSMRTCFALSGLWRIGASAYPGRWRKTQGGASHPGWRFALPRAISLCPVGAGGW